MEKIETITYRGEDIQICRDVHADSPNEWSDDERFIVFDHNQFYVDRLGFEPREISETTSEAKRMFYDGFYVFPLSAYIHSGVRLYIGAKSGWDMSFKGFVLIKRMVGSYHRNKALEQANGLVETWNMYLDGEVYGYSSPAGSCWGFYGDCGKKEMIKEAKFEIDYLIARRTKEFIKRKKVEIKHRVPLNKRSTFAYA